ncbi:MAG TPA: DegV family protein [Solirubrobacteraceae bacterium]
MTQPVAVVTDTTHYLPRALADMQEIHQVSLYVGWKDELERELEMDGFERFYERLRTDPEMPTTSQPSIGDFLAVWEPLIEAGRDIVSIHLASGLSGTYEAARQARGVLAERGLGDRIEVIDGETGAGGLGCLLLAAAASARSGVELKEVAARVHEARQVLKIRFCIDTLEYLQRGGRIGRAQAWLGITMKIKPILSFEREITPVARVRTAGRAFEHLVEYMREMRRDGADGWAVQHIRAPDQAERLVERGREIYGCEPLFVSEVGPVIGTYIGPGGLLIAGIPWAAVAEGARRGQSRRLGDQLRCSTANAITA